MVSVITLDGRDCNVINKTAEDIITQPVEKAILNK
jgi:hypothetical protein